jgi:hypothetical protein
MATPTSDLSEMAEESSQIRITLKSSHRPNVLASVSVSIETEFGVLTINDGRILKNKAGVLWFALPTFSITVGKSYEYLPAIELPAALHRQVSDAALAEFERWERAK